MKTISKLIIMMMMPSGAWAQLQNLDFEQWDKPVDFSVITHNNPTGWICTNRWFGFEEEQFAETFTNPVDTLSQTNKYGLRLFTFYNYMKDAAVQTAPSTDRPAALTGVYKYEHNFIEWANEYTIDTAQVNVLLSKWNSITQQRDTIGLGIWNTADSTPVYRSFRVDIKYLSNELPDSVTLYLDPSMIGRHPDIPYQTSASGGSSTFTLDNLSFTKSAPTTGVNDDIEQQRGLNIYPNPATDWITVDQAGEVIVKSITGQTVIQFEVLEGQRIDISKLSSGTYFLHITHNNTINRKLFVKQ